jgi:predicted TPR repeat methyltransferase
MFKLGCEMVSCFGQVVATSSAAERRAVQIPSPVHFLNFASLGEAYVEAGDKKLAIENYEKSLKLDADNKNAEEMLQKLRQ